MTVILSLVIKILACIGTCAKPDLTNVQTAGMGELFCCGGLLLIGFIWWMFDKRNSK